MSLTQTGPSSHAGSGMFDKLPGPAGADVQQKTDGLIYSIRKKHTISLLYAHMHISTNLSSVVPLSKHPSQHVRRDFLILMWTDHGLHSHFDS